MALVVSWCQPKPWIPGVVVLYRVSCVVQASDSWSGTEPVACFSAVWLYNVVIARGDDVHMKRTQKHCTETFWSKLLLCACAGASGTDWSGSGPTLPDSSNASRSSLPQGAGPRIYVGGIPNAVSETMVRKYFANWGKVRFWRFSAQLQLGCDCATCFVLESGAASRV